MESGEHAPWDVGLPPTIPQNVLMVVLSLNNKSAIFMCISAIWTQYHGLFVCFLLSAHLREWLQPNG